MFHVPPFIRPHRHPPARNRASSVAIVAVPWKYAFEKYVLNRR